MVFNVARGLSVPPWATPALRCAYWRPPTGTYLAHLPSLPHKAGCGSRQLVPHAARFDPSAQPWVLAVSDERPLLRAPPTAQYVGADGRPRAPRSLAPPSEPQSTHRRPPTGFGGANPSASDAWSAVPDDRAMHPPPTPAPQSSYWLPPVVAVYAPAPPQRDKNRSGRRPRAPCGTTSLPGGTMLVVAAAATHVPLPSSPF